MLGRMKMQIHDKKLNVHLIELCENKEGDIHGWIGDKQFLKFIGEDGDKGGIIYINLDLIIKTGIRCNFNLL